MIKKTPRMLAFFAPIALTACGPGSNDTLIARSKAIVDTAQASNDIQAIAGRQPSGIVIGILIVLVFVELAVIAALYLYIRLQSRITPPVKRKWKPGPNARWGREAYSQVSLDKQTRDEIFRREIFKRLMEEETARVFGVDPNLISQQPSSWKETSDSEDKPDWIIK